MHTEGIWFGGLKCLFIWLVMACCRAMTIPSAFDRLYLHTPLYLRRPAFSLLDVWFV